MTDPNTIIPGLTNADGKPVTYGDLAEEVSKGATVLTDLVTGLASTWEENHDPTELFAGIHALVATLLGYSLPMVGALVKADEVTAYLDEQAAAFSATIPDHIDEEV